MLELDTVLYNGEIYTADEGFSVVEAVGIKDGCIQTLGSSQEVRRLAGPAAVEIDLQGRTVIPGIIDSHNHMVMAGRVMNEGLLLFDCQSIEELKNRLAEAVGEREKGEWIEGAGWIENQFEEWRIPTREDLDEVSPDNPVLLRRLFGGGVANSKALELAGVDGSTADPRGGEVEKDTSTGEPTGFLRSRAYYLVSRVMPEKSFASQLKRNREGIMKAADRYLQYGITTVLDPGVVPDDIRAYYQLKQEGRLPLRISMMPLTHGVYRESFYASHLEEWVDGFGFTSGFGSRDLNFGALKLAVDGGLGSRSAWMKKPWLDGTFTDIPLRLDIDKLPDYLERYHRRGWSIGIHCCGDAAVENAVNNFYSLLQRYPAVHRHNIIHTYFASGEDIRKMQEVGLAVSAQPGFIWVEGDIYLKNISREKAASFTPLKSLLEAGIRVACNSDILSNHYNPFLGMHSAVFRQTSRGERLGEKEAVTMEEALPLFTRNGAWLAFLEEETGSLEEGKRADLAVLNNPIFSAPERLLETKALLTMIDGEIVYEDAAEGLTQKRK